MVISCAVSADIEFQFKGNVCLLYNVSSSSELVTELSTLATNETFTDVIESSNFTEFVCFNSNLETIPPALFEKFLLLEKFSAPNVGLREINFGDLNSAEYLSHLDLSQNKISQLDLKVLKHIQNLHVVDFSNNQISSVIDSSANSSGNTSLTEKVKIKFLNLEGNKLKVFNVASLEVIELNLNHNQLEMLNPPDTLEVLLADNNNLKEFFISNVMLNVSVSENQIEGLKCDQKLQLEVLNLSRNRVGNEALIELKRAHNLKILDLSNTMLSELTPYSLTDMKMLEELSLANTRIKKFPFGLFSQQTQLHRFNIASNDLELIDCRWFRPLISLTTFDISDNNLVKLQNCENFNEMFPKLKSISVRGNSWNCKYQDHLGFLFSKFEVSFVDSEREVTVIDAFDIEEASSQLDDFVTAMKKFFGPLHAPKFNASAVKDPFFFVLKTNFEYKINKILGKTQGTNDSQNHEIYEKFWKILVERTEAVSSEKSNILKKIDVGCRQENVS